MKLKEDFEQLAVTAFGPWLAKYKKFFTEKNLDEEKVYLQATLDETDQDYKIVITSNDVYKIRKTQDLFATNIIKEINPHIIEIVFTEITNIQMQKFSEFILHLPVPKTQKGYKDYFAQEELKDGYSKIKAFQEISRAMLVQKFSESATYKDNYQAIAEGAYDLQLFIGSLEIALLGETIEDSTSDCFGSNWCCQS